MERPTITARQIGDALVLVAPSAAAGLADALRSAVTGSPALVVLDLRGLDLLPAAVARALIGFAHGLAERGTGCVLLMGRTGKAADSVLDLADPTVSVRRFSVLEHALAANPAPRADRAIPAPRAGTEPSALAFDSTDLDRTEEFLSTSYAPMRIGSTTGRSDAHITRVAAGTVSADRLDLAFEMSYKVSPLGKICLCDIETGSIADHRVDSWREAEQFGAGDLFSFSPPDQAYSGRIREARYSITMFSPSLLDRVAGAEKPVRLLDHRPVDALATRHLRTAITHVRDNVLGAAAAGENPLVVSEASRYLAASVLAAFPTTVGADQAGSDGDGHPDALRRAIAYLEANAASAISTQDIARAAYVSARAVQLAFRRHLGTTPMAYLRRVRLDCAHAELRDGAPGDTTVTQVAARWGYARPGVFAAHYRAAYGRSPSQTLHED